MSSKAKRRKGSAASLQTFGCGIDVVELARFRRALARGGKRFADRIFTRRELAYARARRRTRLLHLAGRFAAKEAVLKAISQIDPTRMPAMRQVEVRNDRLGRPSIVLRDGHHGRLAIHVSLSHVETVAVASAIAIRERDRSPHLPSAPRADRLGKSAHARLRRAGR